MYEPVKLSSSWPLTCCVLLNCLMVSVRSSGAAQLCSFPCFNSSRRESWGDSFLSSSQAGHSLGSGWGRHPFSEQSIFKPTDSSEASTLREAQIGTHIIELRT